MFKFIRFIMCALLVLTVSPLGAASLGGSAQTTNNVTLKDFLYLDSLRVAITKPGYAILTATQDALGSFNSPANTAANNNLWRRLHCLFIPYLKVTGFYEGVSQGVSFIILAPESQARQLGREYQQGSILTNVGLVYDDGSVTRADHSRDIFSPDAEKADFYTTIRAGLSFSVYLVFDDTRRRRSRPVGNE